MGRRALPFGSAIVLSAGIHAAAAILLGPVESGVRDSSRETGLVVSLAPAGAASGAGEAAETADMPAAGRGQPGGAASVEPAAVAAAPAADAADGAPFEAPEPLGLPKAAASRPGAGPRPEPTGRPLPAPSPPEGTESRSEEARPSPGSLPATSAPRIGRTEAAVRKAAAAAPRDTASATPRDPAGRRDDRARPDVLRAARRTGGGGAPGPGAVRPPGGALGDGAPDGAADAAADYHARLRAWLERHKRYPRRARRRREQGVVVLRFVADRAGAVLDLEVENSSGHPLLDDAALDMVRRAQPLPEMPPGMRESRAEHLLPVRFALR